MKTTLLLLGLVVFCGCDHVLPAKNIKLPELIEEVERDHEQAAEDWEGKWVRFKARVAYKDLVFGIRLNTGSPVRFRIPADPDPASTRFDKYEVGEVHTFRVQITKIEETQDLILMITATPTPNKSK